MDDRRHSRRIAGVLLGVTFALASLASASAGDEACCRYRGGLDGRSTIELNGTALEYVRHPRPELTWWWSGEGECRPHADQVVCVGQAMTSYVVAGIVEYDTSPYRVRLLRHPCLRRGKVHPVTAMISFGTDDPFSRDVSEEILCGDRLPPV